MNDSHADVRADRLYMFQQLFKEPEMTPEGKVKEDVKKYLASLGADCWYMMPMMMGYGKRGVPDFIICYRGFFFAPETKRAGGKSKPWQEAQQEEIRVAGGRSERVVTVEIIKEWVAAVDALVAILERNAL